MSGRLDRLVDRLIDRRLRLAVAESCTGGLLAARLTDRPGASAFFVAGLATYSNSAKTRFLGVQPATLAAYGAVSEPVVVEMVRGAREAADTDAAVAITGIAGPDGGTADKPVGTVWIAVAVAGRERTERFHFRGDRQAVRQQSVDAALELLDRTVEEAS